MSRYNHHHKLRTRDHLYRIFFCIASIIILVLGMPSANTSNYKYNLGEPWDNEPLIATDSFRVLKSEKDLQRERDSLKKMFEPYYAIDRREAAAQVQQLIFSLQHDKKGLAPNSYAKQLQEDLIEIYRHGIMASTDYEHLRSKNIDRIRVYSENLSASLPLDEVYTPRTAYERLMNQDSTRYERRTLMQLDLNRFITTNLVYDETKSNQQQLEVEESLVPYIGQVKVGERIVDRGQIVDSYTYNVLQSMEQHLSERRQSSTEWLIGLGGKALYILIMSLLLLYYFRQFRSDYLDHLQSALFLICMFLIFPLITYAFVQHQFMSVYMIPYCILPVFTRIFMDSRTAFITHTITLLTCAIVLQHPFEFMVIQSVAGLTAIYSLRQLSQRSDLFSAVVLVIVTTLITRLCLELVQGQLSSVSDFDFWGYIHLVIAGVLSTISYLLLIPIERIFGFTSNVTLVELSNINNQVLRRMSEEAPGTFQHSMQVANLAAEVANRIGAKSQLVRTGALYHDIGKVENAVFFTENQNGVNPHDNLPFEQSAGIIINHVADGLKLAEKYKLPQVIKDFILTHHGKSLVKYFYISYKNKYPESPIDVSLFTYPGPNPQTQEQAILMMADAVEAASRSLKSYTEEDVNNLVDRIIDSQVHEGYFNQCPITLLDIQAAKEVFKSKLMTIYHTRIQYPELANKKREQDNTPTTDKQR